MQKGAAFIAAPFFRLFGWGGLAFIGLRSQMPVAAFRSGRLALRLMHCRAILAMCLVVVVVVVVLAMTGRPAALAVDPGRLTFDVVLFFPDRKTLFQLVDHISTGLERFV